MCDESNRRVPIQVSSTTRSIRASWAGKMAVPTSMGGPQVGRLTKLRAHLNPPPRVPDAATQRCGSAATTSTPAKLLLRRTLGLPPCFSRTCSVSGSPFSQARWSTVDPSSRCHVPGSARAATRRPDPPPRAGARPAWPMLACWNAACVLSLEVAFRMSCTNRYKSSALGYRIRYTKGWYCNMI
jgi:hypothetical protein